jgi:hypothetical protein
MPISASEQTAHLRRSLIAPKMSRPAIGIQRRTLLAGTLAVLAAAAMLFFFPPARYDFYPQCPVHQIFGILCPGCGTTRALAALLHGHVVEALQLNTLTVLGLPVVIAWLLFSGQRPLRPSLAIIYAALVVTALFTVGRNL